jgi:hypothetical protein
MNAGKGGAVYLGSLRRPAFGIRIPEILLKGILNASRKRRVAIGFSLSFGRETAPEYIVNAPPGRYPVVMGHTGTSIREYALTAAQAARQKGVPVEIEAGHIMIVKSTARAVQRISGLKTSERMLDSEIRNGIEYIKTELDEAISTGVVSSFTIDTNALIRYDANQMDDSLVESEFDGMFPEQDQKRRLFDYYLQSPEIPQAERARRFAIEKPKLMRLAVKFEESIRYGLEICRLVKEKTGSNPFGIEIALDESNYITRDEELLFYLSEWRRRGGHINFVAPNVGFEKRRDYDGDLSELENRIRRYHSIARLYGATLSFHSGSGSTPHSGKGAGVYEAVLAATHGELKYLISGVYMELVLQVLSSFPRASEERMLYERVFNEVHSYLVDELRKNGELSSPALENQLMRYDAEIESGKRVKTDPLSEFFRHYSFLALNIRDEHGARPVRESIVKLYVSHERFRELVDKGAEELTLRLIDGLDFADNSSGIAY